MDTVTIDVPNSRAIAKQLLTLAKDPENQPFIVQEKGCLAGLVQYTQHEDIEVVLIATRALQFLSSHPANKDVMRDFPNLVNNLTTALARAKEHARIKEFVHGALENLSVFIREEDTSLDDWEQGENDAENQASFLNTVSRRASIGLGFQQKPVKPLRKLGEFRSITLFMQGVGESREKVESLMIQIEGVISVTVNPEREHIVVGTREEDESFVKTLVERLAQENLCAKLVVPPAAKRAENSQYSYIDNEEEDYPDYLEEDDYEDEDAENNARIARQGFSSLEARLEQQRREEERRKIEKSSRLIGKMNSFLSSASNWLMGY